MPDRAPSQYRLSVQDLKALFAKLQQEHYLNVGPLARDGAIMLEPLASFEEMASGFYEDQGRGSYFLDDLKDGSYFGHTVGPQSFKKYLHPSRRLLWTGHKRDDGFDIQLPDGPPKMAFWGIRSCDLEAIRVLDRVFLKGEIVNEWYRQARADLFLIATSCSHPSSNCFCTSMEGGPSPLQDFDISLVEIIDEKQHFFVAEVGSDRAHEIAMGLGFVAALPEDQHAARAVIERAEEQLDQRFKVEEARELLSANLEGPHWEEVAHRCLSCANCTMVCPTCFCTTTEDIIDLTGNHTERWLRQDSCFTAEYSYIHGGVVRASTKSRYRQWITHKFLHWHDQFGSAGCVGCGRCIAWCPVGIDITEEIAKLKDAKQQKTQSHEVHI